ncbi:MAG: cache domain-containing protein [Bacteroidales bacterium]|nr:cache domain-containing protein [Bacteroidales bacterium]
MRNSVFIKKRLPLLILFIAFVLFILSLAGSGSDNDMDRIAEKTAARLEKRLAKLETYVRKAMDGHEDGCLEGLPDDMVIYKYENDSLKFWSNQFPIINDDISRRLTVQRLTSYSNRISSPLSDVTEEVSFMNLGPKWYVVKAFTDGANVRVIAGIEVKNNLIEEISASENGTNPHLKIDRRYAVGVIPASSGSPVFIDGKPLFKIILDTDKISYFFDNSLLRWTGLVLLAVATMLFLFGHRKLRVYIAVVGSLTVLIVVAFAWGGQMSNSYELFSPTLYADGQVFFSLGALMLINTYIIILYVCTYMMREKIAEYIREEKRLRRRRLVVYGVLCALAAAGTLVYTHLTLQSLILNSNISMELYRGNDMVHYTVIVYLSYTGILFCLVLLLQSMQPIVRETLGIRYNLFKVKNLAVFAFLCSLYFTITAAILGFRKEQDRVTVWANRLAVERDLGLEIQLRGVEESIASDQLIATLTRIDNTQEMILNRLSDYYLFRTRQGYNTSVMVFRDNDRNGVLYLNNIMRNGTPIATESNFMFMTDANGRSRYVGIFAFYSDEDGLTRMLVELEPESNREDRGYYSILGQFSNPGDINIPALYSYAKYASDKLTSYKGNYPYPTLYFEDTEKLQAQKKDVVRSNGHVHFLHMIGEEEIIIISRPQRGAMVYFTSFSYLFLALCALLYVFSKNDDKNKGFRRNYFRTRINTILFISSFMILASMTVISVVFVYKRNEVNMHDLMSTKISTIQALVNNRVRQTTSWQELRGQEFSASLEVIGNTTKSDITLYSPDGKVFLSTTPEVFEKMILGSRIDQDAFHSICHENQRFYIQREQIDDYSYWSMYAPIFNDKGDLIAIISSPYTERNYDFRREAFFHAALIFNLFILLLIGSLLFSTREVNSMFSPLLEMGNKMKVADVHNLEYIIYKRDDEISSLVEAYNRMVHDLSDSTRQLAQAERDKAWSQMARQVAHEIKNPLTPIKLQLQRLIRLKENNNPKWEERFDEVSAVILEHIDILTETANEFSTFAKLYSEDPVLIDLDKTLKDQLVIFDNKDNIDISYIGMEDAFVMAPKPQLIRVFVNLITNAVQAVEIYQKEAAERGEDSGRGKVLICLRNSIRDGYYDVVVDDNGSGVSEENLDKLFTPNFTTKSSGTGLGLAICRNIIEKCEGEISYQKSFALGGASFMVTLPKHQA